MIEREGSGPDARFRGLVEAAPDAMIGVDRFGMIAFVNRQAERLFLATAAELVGQPIEILVPEPHREGHSAKRIGYFAAPSVRPMGAGLRLEGRRSDGSTFPAEISLSPFESSEGLLVTAAIRDVTERRRVETDLRLANEQLRAAQDLAHIGIWSIDLATHAVTLSDQVRRILGLSAEEPVPNLVEAITELVAPQDQQSVLGILADALDRTEPFTIEAGLRRGEQVRTVTVFGTVARDEAGAAQRIWGTAQDVTEERESAARLQAADRALRTERETVEQLQRAFLPRLPSLDTVELAATYRPAGTGAVVGGDWYDAFSFGNNQIGLVVGDIAGHGIRAGSLMAQLRNAARAILLANHDPAGVARSLNRMITLLEPHEVATMTVATFDATSRALRWCSAGHPPLVIATPHGVQRSASPDGPPIGAIANAVFTDRSQVLQSHSVVVFYTDGLIERRDEPITAGIDRLTTTLHDLADVTSLDELCTRLCDQLTVDPAPDDVCVLALRCR